MNKNVKKQTEFNKAIVKLRKSRILKIFILSSILLSRGKFSLDLIAQTPTPQPTESFIQNMCISINCEETDKKLAQQLKSVLEELEYENEFSNFIIKELEQNKICFEIVKDDNKYNGAYTIGSNKISIPRNIIQDSYKPNSLQALKRAIVHETTHMIQDKNGIFDDAQNLSPLESSFVYTFAELDAICKSYVATENDFWTVNSIFNCLCEMIPCLDSYTNQGFYASKARIDKKSGISLSNTMEKFNNKGFEKYENFDEIIQTIKRKIDPELMNKLVEENESFLQQLQENQLITSQNLNFEKD